VRRRRKPGSGDWRVDAARYLVALHPLALGVSVLGIVVLCLLLRVGPFEMRRTLCGEFLSQPLPDKPFPGQYTPPCKHGQVSISGGCWARLAEDAEDCGDFYSWRGACYAPAPMGVDHVQKPSTSSVQVESTQ